MAEELSNEAKATAAALFIRGKRARINTADHAALVQRHQAGIDALVAAKLVSRRRRPRHPEVYLFRGSDATAEIGRAWVKQPIPARGRAVAYRSGSGASAIRQRR